MFKNFLNLYYKKIDKNRESFFFAYICIINLSILFINSYFLNEVIFFNKIYFSFFSIIISIIVSFYLTYSFKIGKCYDFNIKEVFEIFYKKSPLFNKKNKIVKFKKSKKYNEEELYLTAIHESGHLMTCAALGALSSSTNIVIHENKKNKNYGFVETFFINEKSLSKEMLLWNMELNLAGAIAENIIFGKSFSGNYSDNIAWEKSANQYLSRFDDNYIFFPLTKEEKEINQNLIIELKKEQKNKLKTFFKNNISVLKEIADYLVEHKKIEYNNIVSFLSKVNVKHLNLPFGDFDNFNEEAFLIRYTKNFNKDNIQNIYYFDSIALFLSLSSIKEIPDHVIFSKKKGFKNLINYHYQKTESYYYWRMQGFMLSILANRHFKTNHDNRYLLQKWHENAIEYLSILNDSYISQETIYFDDDYNNILIADLIKKQLIELEDFILKNETIFIEINDLLLKNFNFNKNNIKMFFDKVEKKGLIDPFN